MDGVSEDEGMDEPIVLWEGGMEGGVSAITIGWDDTWGGGTCNEDGVSGTVIDCWVDWVIWDDT